MYRYLNIPRNITAVKDYKEKVGPNVESQPRCNKFLK